MIKRIFNWSFGAFFKTIGRILAYLSVGFLLAIVCSKFGFNFGYIQVNAANAYDWASSLPSLSRVEMRDCTASNTCTTNVSLTNDGLTTSNYERIMFTTSSQYTIASNGLAFATYYNSLKKGYLYTANFYICSSADITDATPTMYTSVYDSMGVNNMTYTSSVSVNLSNQPGNGSQSFGRCRQYTGLFVPKKDNDPWIILRLKSSKAIKSYFQIIATEVSELGIYTDTIKTIIEESNNDVKQAVTDVKEETKKTNDTITDTSSPDTEESINEWSEKMIDNPLEAVVMLPLTILNSIKNSLSGTCSALNVPVPFINENISIPCISTIFAQIEGVTEFWNSIGTIVSALMLYQYLIYLYNWIDDTISLKTKRMHGWGSV